MRGTRQYCLEHVRDRLKERYNMSISDLEYDQFCVIVGGHVSRGKAIEEKNGNDTQWIADVMLKGQLIKAVWSTNESRVKTVLPNI